MAYVQVYTGNGKGKTTAAIGLTVRALGAGLRVLFLQFMKEKHYSEHNLLPHISDKLTLETAGKPYFIMKKEHMTDELLETYGDSCVIFEPGQPPADYVALAAKAVERAREAAHSGEYDLIVLDELNCALFFELVSWPAVEAILKDRAPNTELVLTGRNAPPELIEAADLATEFRELKHYYAKGVEARKGIEM